MQKKYLSLPILIFVLSVFNGGAITTASAAAPIEDFSTDAAAKSNGTINNSTTPAATATTSGDATSVASPSWQETTKDGSAMTTTTTAPAATMPATSSEERIRRLEQQINYLNKNNSQAEIEDLKQKLQKANGDLEVEQDKVTKLEKQLDDFYTDLDQRLKEKDDSKKNKERTVTERATTKKPLTMSASDNDDNYSARSENKKPAVTTPKKTDNDELNTSITDTEATITKISKAQKSKGKSTKKNQILKNKANTDQDEEATPKTAATKKTSHNASSDTVATDESDNSATNNAAIPADLNLKKKEDALKEQQAYQAAFNYLQNKQFNDGAKELKKYLTAYPDGLYAANAHYWLGEIYFLNNSYAKASSEFDAIVAKYAASPKIPEALFKLAYIHDKEGKHDQAQKEYSKLMKRFPKSAAAKLAEQQLKA